MAGGNARAGSTRALRALALSGLLCVSAACAAPPRGEPIRGGEIRLSLLALGDWGRRPQEDSSPPKQFRVGQALAEEDRRAPADALVFLGDNFYPRGLIAAELEPRLRLNVVTPYCRFVRLTELGRRTFGDACPDPESLRHPVPLWAVLGNHDYGSAESPELERARIPEYVANWRLFGSPVETLELPQGVSLVFYDSTLLRLPSQAAQLHLLTRALRESAGPWRILVAHHPLENRGVSLGIESAIAESGVRPQLILAGHIHDLRAGAPPAPLPAFQLVSGGGGGAESSGKVLPGELFQLASTGFARIELARDGVGEYLRVRIHEVDGSDSHAVAAWTISPEGAVLPETLR